MVHKWTPCHRELLFRSHVDKTIVLLKIGERYVPIVETAIEYIEDSGCGNGGKEDESANVTASE